MNIFKKSCYGFLITMCFGVLVYAESARESAEEIIKALADKSNATYTCEGNETKANCTISRMDIDNTLSLRNLKVETLCNDNETKTNLTGNLSLLNTQKITKAQQDVIPTKLSCEIITNINSKILGNNFNCNFTAPIYSLQINGNGELQSDLFQGKNLQESMLVITKLQGIIDNETLDSSSQNFLRQFKVNPKQLVVNIDGAKLGNGIFAIYQESEPTATKEQYNASVAMGVVAIPVGLTQTPNLSKPTIEGITKISNAIGDILLSRKQKTKITLKRKSTAQLLDLQEFINKVNSADNLQSLLPYLNDYDIIVTSN